MRCPFCGHGNLPGAFTCEECGSELAGLDLPGAGTGFRSRLLNDRLSDLDISKPTICSPDTTVADAVEAMRAASCGCVLIVEDGTLIGIFNERHVLTRVLRKGMDAAGTPLSQVMSRDPLELSPSDPPAFAVHAMVTHGFRHLPVVSDGELQGYVSVHNILAYLHRRVIPDAERRE